MPHHHRHHHHHRSSGHHSSSGSHHSGGHHSGSHHAGSLYSGNYQPPPQQPPQQNSGPTFKIADGTAYWETTQGNHTFKYDLINGRTIMQEQHGDTQLHWERGPGGEIRQLRQGNNYIDI